MLKKLWIKDIRNLSEISIDFSLHNHCYIYGGNNQGKTSVLEALYLAFKGQSPIQSDIEKVIHYSKAECMVGVDFIDKEPKRLYARFFKDGKKDIRINQKKVNKTQLKGHMLEYLSADALHLFQKEPDFRRKHLDRFCTVFFTDYEKTLKAYEKIVRQKNKYLKQSVFDSAVLDTYNRLMVDKATYLVHSRIEALREIEVLLRQEKMMTKLLDHPISLTYRYKSLDVDKNLSYRDCLYVKLKDNVEKERILGYSVAGPHRDDFGVMLGDQAIFDFFSRGINRCISLLFYLVELKLLYSNKVDIYVLLDDVFAEVDEDNKKYLIKRILDNYKVIYATTTTENLIYFKNVVLLYVKEGKILYEEN